MRWVNSQKSQTRYLMQGGIKAALVMYDGCTSKGDPNKYHAEFLLPGVKAYQGHYPTEEEAQKVLEGLLIEWIDKAGLTYLGCN